MLGQLICQIALYFSLSISGHRLIKLAKAINLGIFFSTPHLELAQT